MGTIKLLLVLGFMGALFYVGVEVIPPYFANYEFQDSLDTEARMGTYSVKADDIIRDAVFKRAQELELPITKDQIKIQRTGPSGNGAVFIETEYSVHIDLPGYPLDLSFHPQSKNKSAFSFVNLPLPASHANESCPGFPLVPHNVTPVVTKCPRHA